MNRSRVQHIDVWRCIAIGLVLTSHVLVFSHPWYKTVLGGIAWRLEILGLLGVKIFFCISGYVICRGMVKEASATGSVDMPAFYRRRAYRILPPLFAYIAVVGLLTAIGVLDISPAQFARAAAFLCNISAIGPCGWALGHTWSLAYEEQFYLLFPLLFSALAFAAHRRRILFVIGMLATGCVVTCVAGMVIVNAGLSYVRCMLSGCACALYWDKLQPMLNRLPVTIWCAAVFCIPCSAYFAPPAVVSQIVVPLLMPIAICVAVFGTPAHHPAIRKLFGRSDLAYIGRISYGIYLWQQLATANYGFTSPAPTLALLAAACVLAHYSYKYFELPLIKRGALPSARAPKGETIARASVSDDPLADDATSRRLS